MKDGQVKTILIGPWSMRIEHKLNGVIDIKTKNVITGVREHKRESYNVRQLKEQGRQLKAGSVICATGAIEEISREV